MTFSNVTKFSMVDFQNAKAINILEVIVYYIISTERNESIYAGKTLRFTGPRRNCTMMLFLPEKQQIFLSWCLR